MYPKSDLDTVALAQKPQSAPISPEGSNTRPRATVIIVNYNGKEYLSRTLSSLLNDRLDYEIILVDNASKDKSAQYVEQAFPQVQVIRNEANLGFGQGNNLGALQARGEYLAFLNPDTVVEQNWLESLIAALEGDPQAGLATSKILLMGAPDKLNTCGNEVHCTGITLCRGVGQDRDAFAEREVVGAISGAAFVARREIFEQLQGFDTSFFLYMEDTDLSWRARLAGYHCLYVPTSIVHHDYTLRIGPTKTFYQERNRYLMLLKNLRWRTLLVWLPILMLGEVVTWGFVLLHDRPNLKNKLAAYAWIPEHWGEILESRQRAQATRQVRDRDLLAACTHRLDFDQTKASIVARIASSLFDPAFYTLHRVCLALTRW